VKDSSFQQSGVDVLINTLYPEPTGTQSACHAPPQGVIAFSGDGAAGSSRIALYLRIDHALGERV
jgi:hypothetical protein